LSAKNTLRSLLKRQKTFEPMGLRPLIALKTVSTYTSLAGPSQSTSNHAMVRHWSNRKLKEPINKRLLDLFQQKRSRATSVKPLPWKAFFCFPPP